MRKFFWIIPALMLFALLVAPDAHGQTYDYTLSGIDNGTIDITVSGTTITAVTGTFDGVGIFGLAPAGGFGDNDNVYSSSTVLDFLGIGFMLDYPNGYGNSVVNLYWADTSSPLTFDEIQSGCEVSYSLCLLGDFTYDGPYGPDYLTLTASPTPEPGTAVLWLTGIVLLIVMMRKRSAQGLPQAS